MIADRGFAAAAVAAGIETIALADVDAVVLGVAARREHPVRVVPIDEQRPPGAYTPLCSALVAALDTSVLDPNEPDESSRDPPATLDNSGPGDIRSPPERGRGVSRVAQSFADARFLTVQEVAEKLRVSSMTVYRLIKNGDLPAVRVGRSFRVRDTDVDAYLASRYTQAG